MDTIPMTAAGYSTLEAELKHCQQVERPRIIQQITDARTHGDLSENAEYHAAKESQSLNEGRIAELEDKLARAEVIDVSKLSGEIDFILKCVAPDLKTLQGFVAELTAAPHVRNVKTSLSLRNSKDAATVPMELVQAD